MTSVYVTALEAASGKSAVTLGLMEMFSRRVGRLGFYRPMTPEREWPDNDVELMRTRYRLPFTHDEMVGIGTVEARERLATYGRDAVLGTVLDRFRQLRRRCDAIVCEGTDFTGAAAAVELEINAMSAKHLDCRVVAVVNGHDRSAATALSAAHLARRSLADHGCTPAAMVVNRVPPAVVPELTAVLSASGAPEPVWVIPEVPELAEPTVAQVVAAIGGTVVPGTDDGQSRRVRIVKVAAMGLPSLYDHLTEEGTLLVTGGDRADVLSAALAAFLSGATPPVAAVVAAGGVPPAPQVVDMIGRARGGAFPVVVVDSDTYRTALAVEHVRAGIGPTDAVKIATALGVFEASVDTEQLAHRLEVERSPRVTPLMFEYDLVERASQQRRHIVLPEGTEPRVLRAAEIVLRRDIADLTLLGDPGEIRAAASALGVDVGGARIEDPHDSPRLPELAARYFEARRHRGVSQERAFDLMADSQYYGTMLVAVGAADGMVSGASHPTGHTIRPALELLRAGPPTGSGGPTVVSSVFFMCLPDQVLVYGDCAINTNPTAAQLADIAIASAGTARRFGVQPRVAMLSYSTGTSGAGQDVDRVREATELVRRLAPELPVAGPIQYDAAVDPSVAATKLPGSEVAGRATVLIFPDLESGNTAYKAVQRAAGALAVGPVLQGLRKPVNDLSRGCTVDDIVTTVAITAVQAQDQA